MSVLLNIIQPAGIVMLGNISFQKKDLYNLASNKPIPVFLLKNEDINNPLKQICKTINEYFPFSYFNQVKKPALHIGCGNHPISE